MKSICLHFYIHQPFMFKRYRFFDIDNEHYYYDDHWNETATEKLARNYYVPITKMLNELIEEYSDQFKIALSISGVTLDLFKIYSPDLIEQFQRLIKTGNAELIGETYSNSLASIKNENAFKKQILLHSERLKELFDYKPTIFKNTKMFYSDELGKKLSELGYQGIVTTGVNFSENVKNPNHLFVNALNKRFKILFDDQQLINLFYQNHNSENGYETIKNYIDTSYADESIINLSLDYKLFSSLIIENELSKKNFLSWIQDCVKDENISFQKPSEVITQYQPYSSISIKNPVGYSYSFNKADNLSFNQMQNEAIGKLYELQPQMEMCNDKSLLTDWLNLQSSDHFFYMSKEFYDTDHDVIYSKPYDSPYEAFINYMNILSDFKIQLNKEVPLDKNKQDIQSLQRILQEKDKEINELKEKIKNLQK